MVAIRASQFLRPNSPRAQLTEKYALAESRCQSDDPASASPSSSQTSSRRLLGVALGIGVYRRRAGIACTSPCKSRFHWAREALNMQVSKWLAALSCSLRPADPPRSITRLRAPCRELSNSELNLSWAVRIERPSRVAKFIKPRMKARPPFSTRRATIVRAISITILLQSNRTRP